MLSDTVRTEAYRAAVEEVVKPGMTVLDFGTGSGVLAFFAQRAGAKRVYAVDRSPFLRAARALAKQNGFDRVTFIEADTDFELPERVDVIVSECMGHYVLNEHMVDALLSVRDAHLAPGGVVIPSRLVMRAGLAIAPVVPELEFFDQARYGIDFSPLHTLATARRVTTRVPAAAVFGDAEMGAIDLRVDEAEPMCTHGTLTLERGATVHGLVGWFDAVLSPNVVLHTGPTTPETHWAQSVFPFEKPARVPPGRVDIGIDAVFADGRNFWRWRMTWVGGEALGDSLVRLHFMRPRNRR